MYRSCKDCIWVEVWSLKVPLFSSKCYMLKWQCLLIIPVKHAVNNKYVTHVSTPHMKSQAADVDREESWAFESPLARRGAFRARSVRVDKQAVAAVLEQLHDEVVGEQQLVLGVHRVVALRAQLVHQLQRLDKVVVVQVLGEHVEQDAHCRPPCRANRPLLAFFLAIGESSTHRCRRNSGTQSARRGDGFAGRTASATCWCWSHGCSSGRLAGRSGRREPDR